MTAAREEAQGEVAMAAVEAMVVATGTQVVSVGNQSGRRAVGGVVAGRVVKAAEEPAEVTRAEETGAREVAVAGAN